MTPLSQQGGGVHKKTQSLLRSGPLMLCFPLSVFDPAVLRHWEAYGHGRFAIWYLTQLIRTTCQTGHHSHFWDHGRTGQLFTWIWTVIHDLQLAPVAVRYDGPRFLCTQGCPACMTRLRPVNSNMCLHHVQASVKLFRFCGDSQEGTCS